jgi:hypothetical protein
MIREYQKALRHAQGRKLCRTAWAYSTIIRNRHPELVSGSAGYRKSEMLKKFQHGSGIADLSIFDYGLWAKRIGLMLRRD